MLLEARFIRIWYAKIYKYRLKFLQLNRILNWRQFFWDMGVHTNKQIDGPYRSTPWK